jgi:hypothetical protein
MPCLPFAVLRQAKPFFASPLPFNAQPFPALPFLCTSKVSYALPSQKPNAFFAFSFLYFSFYIINNYMSYII